MSEHRPGESPEPQIEPDDQAPATEELQEMEVFDTPESGVAIEPFHVTAAARTLMSCYRRSDSMRDPYPYPAFSRAVRGDEGLLPVLTLALKNSIPLPPPDKPDTVVWVLPVQYDQRGGTWTPDVPGFPGLCFSGKTEEDAYRQATVAVGDHIDIMFEDGDTQRLEQIAFKGGIVWVPSIVIVRTTAIVEVELHVRVSQEAFDQAWRSRGRGRPDS